MPNSVKGFAHISHLCYASNCFFPALSRSLLNCLVKLHKSGIRAVFQAPRRTATAPLLAKLSIPSLHQVLLQKLLVFVFRSIHGSASSLFQDYFVLLAQPQIPLADRIVTRGQLHNLLRTPIPTQSCWEMFYPISGQHHMELST